MATKKKKIKIDKEEIKEKLWLLLLDIMHEENSEGGHEGDPPHISRWRIESEHDDGFSAWIFGDKSLPVKAMREAFLKAFPPPPPQVIKLEVPMTNVDKQKIIEQVATSCLNKAAKDAILKALK